MSLRQLAEADLAVTLEDAVTGFGWAITVTPPTGDPASLTGSSDDIGQLIDPDTGTAVTGRLASVALRISSLAAAGLGIPEGIRDQNQKPWLMSFDDIGGKAYIFKVVEANPDRALGVVVCILESHAPN